MTLKGVGRKKSNAQASGLSHRSFTGFFDLFKVSKMTNYDSFKVSKMTVFYLFKVGKMTNYYDLFKVCKMTNFNYD